MIMDFKKIEKNIFELMEIGILVEVDKKEYLNFVIKNNEEMKILIKVKV